MKFSGIEAKAKYNFLAPALDPIGLSATFELRHSILDPHSGLELAGRHNPSLILLDINLPDMDGFEGLKRFRAMDSLQRVPVVAVSANAMPQDIENAILSGFDDYVTKPFDISWLLKVIDNQLGKDSGK